MLFTISQFRQDKSCNSHLNNIEQYWTIFDNIGQYSTTLSHCRWYWTILFSIVQYLMLLTISQVIWQFRQDHALSKPFHCDFNFDISSSRTSFRSLKTLFFMRIFFQVDLHGITQHDVLCNWPVYCHCHATTNGYFRHTLHIMGETKQHLLYQK